jgi:DNA primase
MRNVSSTSGPINYGETSWEAGDIADFDERDKHQNLIKKANSVAILKIFKMYNIKIDDINRKIVCPFRSHKGGRESTASFYYYPNTNTYWCYGCKQGAHPVDFVMNMDGCTRTKAAQKIIEQLSIDFDNLEIITQDDFFETLKIMVKFSDYVRNFRMNFSDEKSFDFIEKHCKIFDDLTQKHQLNNNALEVVVDKLIQAIEKYNL